MVVVACCCCCLAGGNHNNNNVSFDSSPLAFANVAINRLFTPNVKTVHRLRQWMLYAHARVC